MFTAGVILLVLGVALMVAETQLPGGLAGAVGIGAVFAATLLLSGSGEPAAETLSWIAAGSLIVGASALTLLAPKIRRSQREPVHSGPESLIGRSGEIRSGMIFIDGALWEFSAESEPLADGSVATVRAVEGLRLRVGSSDQ